MTLPNMLIPVTLSNDYARLEPLSQRHCADLQEAVGNLYQLPYTSIPTPAGMADEIDYRLKTHAIGTMLPFAAINPVTGKAVGMTRYWNIDSANQRLELGGTWTSKTMQRSAFNTACKHLLLQYAFETLQCIAVEMRAHRCNLQSRTAIERLGAQLDGIMLRDLAVYSITAAEWPTVDAHLRFQLTRKRA
jgi:RimJ/RimL family protein N-acetyltransferase